MAQTLSVPFCRDPRILLGTLHSYYSRAGEVQFCSTSHFYLILKLILMISLYFEGRNHQKCDFSDFFGFYHFLSLFDTKIPHQNSYVGSIDDLESIFPE